MSKALITTVPFGDKNRLPFELLKNAGIDYLINPHNKKLTEDELADSSADLELDRQGVGVVELEGDASFEARIDPAGILDEQAHAPDGAPALDEGGQAGGHLHVFQGGGQEKRVGRKRDLVAFETPVLDLGGHRQAVHAVLVDEQEMAAEPAIDGGGLDGVFGQGFDRQLAAVEHFPDGLVGKNHLGQPAQGLRPPSTPLVVMATAS